jgi:prepilin-type N-terminal cleavage/methylation domain-containing protein
MKLSLFIKSQRGITLLEIMIACLILAIIASVAIPKYQDLRQKAMEESEEYLISVIKNGIELYKTGLMK